MPGEQHILPDQLILNYLKQQTPHALAEACAVAVGQDKTIGLLNTQTSLRTWAVQKRKEGVMSQRLTKALLELSRKVQFLEDVCETDFSRMRNVGAETKEEFEKLMCLEFGETF